MLRFDPFNDVDALARGLMTGAVAGTARTPRFMPLDLYKVDDHYMLVADLPGADPGSIDVAVDNGVLTLSRNLSRELSPAGVTRLSFQPPQRPENPRPAD